MVAEGIGFPASGTGKNNRVLKIDLVNALLKAVLGDSVSDKEFAEIRNRLARESTQQADEDGDEQETMDDGTCPEEILNIVQSLDPDNQ